MTSYEKDRELALDKLYRDLGHAQNELRTAEKNFDTYTEDRERIQDEISLWETVMIRRKTDIEDINRIISVLEHGNWVGGYEDRPVEIEPEDLE